jgi:hypothetical protein
MPDAIDDFDSSSSAHACGHGLRIAGSVAGKSAGATVVIED